jgi:transcriptional regulator with XRE-family HTH domain
VSLGYLSEVERGRKEASSELLASICDALDLPLDELLRGVASDVGPVYLPEVPDTVPDELVAQSADADSGARARRSGPEGGRLVGSTTGQPAGPARVRQADLRVATAEARPGGARAMVSAAAA